MEPYYEHVPRSESVYFIKREIRPCLDSPWHYHPEMELTIIDKSRGKRFVGSSIEDFEEGDMVFYGSNLPHAYINDSVYRKPNSTLEAQAFVLQFTPNLLGKTFFQWPENNEIAMLFRRASFGMKFYGGIVKETALLMEHLQSKSGFDGVIIIMQILNQLSKSNDFELLNSKQSVRIYQSSDASRFNKIYAHLTSHFRHSITIAEIASIAGLSDTAFCRYFKERTGSTFTEFLHKMRIEYASSLLSQTELSISQVAETSGYPNLSNFNRQFKRIRGKTPRDVKNEFKQDELNKKVDALDLS